MKYAIRIIALLFFVAGRADACPNIEGLVDMNCDGKLKIAATGDSIVRGVGDSGGGPRNAGWVYDLGQLLPECRVTNLGVSGTTSQRLRRLFIKNLVRGNEAFREMIRADYVIVEVGTNEYHNRTPVSTTVLGITRLVQTLRSFFTDKLDTTPPIFIVATVTQSKRSFQNPFLLELSRQLLQQQEKLNVRIRFDSLGTGVIGSDQLHPNAAGYREMAKLVKRVLYGVIQSQARSKRPDGDDDGIYDLFEPRYGTDPDLADTDDDSYSDGEEVFESETDPLDPLSYPGSDPYAALF